MEYSMLDSLPKASNQELLYLCDRHKVPGKALSKEQMLKALLERFSDREYIYRTVKGLPRPARLTLLAYSLTMEWWSVMPRLDRMLQQPHEPYLADLKALGFMSGSASVPIEAAEAAIRIWVEEMANETPPPPQVLMPDPHGPGALRDIFALVGMGWRRELPLTKGGKLFKKAEDEMLDRLEGSPAISGDGVKMLVLSYALNRGLLAHATYDENEKTGFSATDRVDDWAKASWSEIWTDLADYLLTSRAEWLRPVPDLIDALNLLPQDQWVPLGRIGADCQALCGTDARGLESLLVLMAGLGLLVIGTGGKQGVAVRPSPALRALFQGEEPRIPGGESRFLVDPTFTVTAPKSVSPAVLARLERWCGERKADTVLTYRLSQASLRVALEEGDKPADLIRFFTENARNELPQNVLFSLREWTAKARRARFEQLTLLRVDDAETAERILSDKGLRKWLFGQITPTDLIMEASAVEKVRKRLGEIGVATVQGVARPGKAETGPKIVWQNEETLPGPMPPDLFRLKWVGGPDPFEER